MAVLQAADHPVLVEWCVSSIVARAIDAGVAALGEVVVAARDQYEWYRRRVLVLDYREGEYFGPAYDHMLQEQKSRARACRVCYKALKLRHEGYMAFINERDGAGAGR